MSDTLLQATLHAIVTRVASGLPAAYALDPGEMVISPEVEAHRLPEDGIAVRWPLGDEDGFLIVAVTTDAADQLRAGPPEQTLVQALTERVEAAAVDLAPIFDGIPPMLGEGEELPADQVLTNGPGDAVTIPLDDAGTLRATIGLRLVVTDELMAAALDPELMDELYGEDAQHIQQAPGGIPLSGQAQGLGAADLGQRAGAPIGSGVVGAGGGRGPQQPRSPQSPPVGEAHPADFASFDQLTALPGRDHSMALLGEVELGVTAELGRTELTVREVLGLTPGSIIELDRAAGSPVDVVVNGTLIARGEVVVIDEEFGIRITEILGMAQEASPFPMAQ